jgi:hypothetical protein
MLDSNHDRKRPPEDKSGAASESQGLFDSATQNEGRSTTFPREKIAKLVVSEVFCISRGAKREWISFSLHVR